MLIFKDLIGRYIHLPNNSFKNVNEFAHKLYYTCPDITQFKMYNNGKRLFNNDQLPQNSPIYIFEIERHTDILYIITQININPWYENEQISNF